MKIRSIVESGSRTKWYKGISVFGGLEHHPREVGATNILPLGFLGNLYLAFIYADPTLTGGENDPSIIIEVIVNDADVEDRTEEFFELGYKDVSMSFPLEWRDEGPWTVRGDGASSGAHGDSDFVFIGVPWKYRVIASFANVDEWERAFSAL